MRIEPKASPERNKQNTENIFPRHVLIFTKATDYVHDSIPAAASYVELLCVEYGWTCVVSDDSSLLEGADAPSFDIIVLVNNSGELFDLDQEKLTSHINGGRGVIGIHACLASFLNGMDAEGAKHLSATTNLIETVFGTHFLNHPPVQEAEIDIDQNVARTICPSLAERLPRNIRHTDEYFNFSLNPADIEDVVVLASVREETYEGGLMGARHPIVWCRYLGESRAPVFYCGIGHFSEFYEIPEVNIATLLLRAGFEFVSDVMDAQ